MKRGNLITFLSLAALAVFVWLYLSSQSGPSYQGKSLRAWLATYTTAYTPDAPLDGSQTQQADDAVRQIGTNAIPTLLEMLQEKDSPSRLKWIAFVRKLRIFSPPISASTRNYQAARGFQALGEDAGSAAPALAQIYRKKISPSSQQQALEALRAIGPSALPVAAPVLLDGLTNSSTSIAGFAIGEMHGQPETFLPALINALKDPNPRVQSSAVRALAKYGPAAKPAVPALIPLLKDPYLSTHRFAADALKAIDPQAAVPALINALNDSHAEVRSDSAWALAAYGPAAKSAVPALLDLCKNDPDPSVRADAASALKKIDPASASAAGIK